MVACLALFRCVVTGNNLLDYGANFAFGACAAHGHSVSGSPLRWRAIDCRCCGTWPMHSSSWEGVTAVSGAGRGSMACAPAQARVFNQAKQWALAYRGAGGFCGLVPGSMVVGAEWFLMWQSSQWNGQESALRSHHPAGGGDLRQPARHDDSAQE